jgi:spermidine synthase
MGSRLLHIAVFVAGFTTLGLEMAASRLLGSVFGTTNLVWANIIGLILLYLTAGYFLGGRWADRSPHLTTFYRILAWGAFSAGLVPAVARPVLRFASEAVARLDAAVMAGSFLSVLVLFVVPITLLGCVSPFAIRLAIDDRQHAGRVSGRVYALSTLGSILGVFLPVLLLIPWLGTALTFLVLSMALLLVALIGLFRFDRQAAWRFSLLLVILLVVSWLSAVQPLKQAPGQVYEGESGYNYIQVIEQGQARYLLLNEGQAIHSVYSPNQLATYGTWDYFLAAPYFNPVPAGEVPVERLGIVGLAAGTIAKQYTQVFGSIPIDGWEIDPEIIEVGRQYFAMTEPNLDAIVADGRLGLERSQHVYSVIAIDAYRPPYIPWHLTTVEFFSLVHERLAGNGVLVINVGRTPDDRRLIEAMVGTLSQVFASIHVVDVPNTFNSMVYASVQPTQADDLRFNADRLAQAQPGSLLADVLQRAASNLQPTPDSSVVFADDHAPVEQLVNSIVINYMLENSLSIVPEALP